MKGSYVIDTCLLNGLHFFTGVPDSLLKGLCDELYVRFGVSGDTHIVAHNEGGALALCAGHYLATKTPGVCYMQNSGLGNAINPLVSLMDPKVYGLPCLLIIGWRGAPGVKDEPQHVRQGAITLGQLDLLEIPYRILAPDTTIAQFDADFQELLSEMKRGKTVAFVVEKGAIQSDLSPVYGNEYSMTRETAAGLILSAADPEDVFVTTTGKLSREVFEWRESRNEDHARDFLTVGSMGHASMIALGMAVDKPDRRIWCLDGDGALLMHLGALQLIAERQPSNLVHVIINNEAHDTVGGMPVSGGSLNASSLASAAGYPSVFTVNSEETLKDALKKITGSETSGPVLLEVRCACGSRANLGRPTTTPAQNRDALMSFLQ